MDLASETDLHRYLMKVAPMCPYLQPSLRDGSLIFFEVKLETMSRADESVIPEIFAIGAFLSERILDIRLTAPRPLLYSENALVRGIQPFVEMHPFEYPHFILKCLYRQFGLVYGKFKLGAEASLTRKDAPVNPFDIFTIRQQTKANREAQFFARHPELAADFNARAEFGQFSILRRTIRRIYLNARQKDVSETYQSFRTLMFSDGLYDAALESVNNRYAVA